MAAAAASSARTLFHLLRPRQQLLQLRFAAAPARLPERRYCFLLLQQQPHRSWAAIGAATSRGGSSCEVGYPQQQAPAVRPEGAPAPPREEGEAAAAACGCGKAMGARDDDDDDNYKGAAPPAPPEALRAAGRRRPSSSTPPKRRPGATQRQVGGAAPAKRKGKGGPAPPGGGPKEGPGGRGGVHH